MRLVPESYLGQFEPPKALDVNPAEGIDENVRHRGILEQRFQRAQSHDFMMDLSDKLFSFAHIEQNRLLF